MKTNGHRASAEDPPLYRPSEGPGYTVPSAWVDLVARVIIRITTQRSQAEEEQ